MEILRQVHDIGPVVAQSIADFFAETHNLEVIDAVARKRCPLEEREEWEAMRQAQSVPGTSPAAVKSGAKLSCLTGTLPNLDT